MTALATGWQELLEERRSELGWHLRRLHPEACCGIYAAINQPGGVLGLIVEAAVSALGRHIQLPKSAGFQVETTLLGHSHHGQVRITLSLAHPAYASVFAILCADAIDVLLATEDETFAVEALIGRLHAWHSFMASSGPDGLSEAAMIGLMGELLVLRDYVIPLVGAQNAVNAWAGPRGEPNDFSVGRGYLEVKATTRQAPDRLSISNVDQLDISRGPILLGHVRFRELPDGETLPDMVESLRALLAIDAPLVLPIYANALLSAGYVDAQRSFYVKTLHLQAFEVFEVTEDFPRIARGDLRQGIVDCTYMIDLADCRPWQVSSSSLNGLLGGLSG